MKIRFENCNNINNGEISISENKLNIKYAFNGTGKTTISKAIVGQICRDDKLMSSLTPFKYISDSNEGHRPKVFGIEGWASVKIFNEEYINQYVFQQDELLKNSFDVFIRTPEYEEHMKNIEKQVDIIKRLFKENPDLEAFLKELYIFIDGFGKAKSGYSKSGSLGKGLGNGNKLANIPPELEGYSDFLKQDLTTVKWLKWQLDGQNYIESSDKCPFCTHNITDSLAKIKRVSKEYKSKDIEHLLKMLEVFQNLSKYFTNETNEKINQIALNADGLNDDQLSYLIGIKKEVESLKNKLEKIRDISFESLKDVERIGDELEAYKVNICFLEHLQSEYTKEKVKTINDSLDLILKRAGILKGEVNKQKKQIHETVRKYNDDINEFLRYAGYKYEVALVEDDDSVIRLKIKHNDILEGALDNVKSCLSFGERNAFALVLFMYDTIKENPDLIILDDPISSFDGNKKFAILNKLFTGSKKKSFSEHTVLLLTHEFSTVIDTVYNLSHIFNYPYASYLENHNGYLKEKEITKKDIKSFNKIALKNIKESRDNLSKLIYLRRYIELNGDKDDAWQLLSNYFKKRVEPNYRDLDTGNTRAMTNKEIIRGEKIIGDFIQGEFSYKKEVDKIQDVSYLIKVYYTASNGYEKLQIYRLLMGGDFKNEEVVVRKFVNETYHVENDYLFQLNPLEYEVIPDYIISICDECVEDLKNNS